MQPETDYDNENYDSFFSAESIFTAAFDILRAMGIAATLIALWFIWLC
jgi:hypothetical protein